MSAPLLLFWDDPWVDFDDARKVSAGVCEFSLSRGDFERADAVIFPAPKEGGPTPRSRAFPEQVWIQWSQESAVNYPSLDDDGLTSVFDLSATYRLTSDVRLPYLTAGVFRTLPDLIGLRDRSTVLASASISSRFDECGRVPYLRDLMQSLPIASFGKVENHTDIDLDLGASTKLEVMRRYRFTLAFENSRATDYVTENTSREGRRDWTTTSVAAEQWRRGLGAPPLGDPTSRTPGDE